MARPDPTPAADSDGYIDGARDRALVLDWLSVRNSGRSVSGHPGNALSVNFYRRVRDSLIADGLVIRVPSSGLAVLTPAGFAAHAAAQRALADLAAGVAAAG